MELALLRFLLIQKPSIQQYGRNSFESYAGDLETEVLEGTEVSRRGIFSRAKVRFFVAKDIFFVKCSFVVVKDAKAALSGAVAAAKFVRAVNSSSESEPCVFWGESCRVAALEE